MIDETMQLSEKDKIIEGRKAKNRARKKALRRKIKRHNCKECGLPKHYICLEHYQQRPPLYRRLPKKIRYYAKRFCFAVARKAGLTN